VTDQVSHPCKKPWHVTKMRRSLGC
jgi:hypothetical protein